MGRQLAVSQTDIEKIKREEGVGKLHVGRTYKNASTLLDAVILIPSYNETLFKIIDVNIDMDWDFDVPIYLATFGNRDMFSDGTSILTPTARSKSGHLNFKYAFGMSAEQVTAYSGGVATTGGITAMVSYTQMTNDMDWDANKKMTWIGDSISAGTVNSDLRRLDYFQFKVKKYLNDVSLVKSKFRLSIFAAGGKTSADADVLVAYNRIQVQPDIIFYQLGVNDASQAIGLATYESNLLKFIEYKQSEWPDAVLIMLGSTPVENDSREATLDTYRNKMSDVVTTVNDAKIKFINLKDCYNRKLGALIWAGSDGTGSDRLHPGTKLAHKGIADCICYGITYTGTVGGVDQFAQTTNGLQQHGINI